MKLCAKKVNLPFWRKKTRKFTIEIGITFSPFTEHMQNWDCNNILKIYLNHVIIWICVFDFHYSPINYTQYILFETDTKCYCFYFSLILAYLKILVFCPYLW